jgi:hypothetical protein
MDLLTVNGKNAGNREVFSGWKDIANYLGKAVRTVERYERTLKLPIRRPAGKYRGSVIAIRTELDLWVLSASMREPAEMLKAPLRVAGYEGVENLQKAVAQMQTVCSEARQMRAELRLLRVTFTHQMQLVRAALALNVAEESNVTSIDSVTSIRKPPLAVRKHRHKVSSKPVTSF